jgi:glutathione synthase/RimK-type ligase-like ATP-grasp enzyme
VTVALVTASTLPEPDRDEPLLVAALAERGVTARVVAWDDGAVEWSRFHLVVLRSTWNYVGAHAEFCAWADRVAALSSLANPAEVVRWNTDKGYLETLAARRIPTVPTRFVARGAAGSVQTIAAELGASDVVVKPRISAGSFATARFDLRHDLAAAEAFLRAHAAERAMMVQPYLRSVDDWGERSLVWIDGELTHAMRKSPRFAGDDESVRGPLPIEDDERELALWALAPLAERLLYARIDLARGDDGRPMIMELELVEPSLFLAEHPPALGRLADAIARRSLTGAA